MKLVWLTDIHLKHDGGSFLSLADSVRKEVPERLARKVRLEHPDVTVVVVTGDIAESDSFGKLIELFAEELDRPVYFVLGNHDFSHSSFAQVRQEAARMNGRARWLVSERRVNLAPGVVLVGQDGWYDARNGKARGALEPDASTISDFFGRRWRRGDMMFSAACRRIADECATEAYKLILEGLKDQPKQIIFATHVPPFAEAAWHEGKLSDDSWLPWMSSHVMGKMLSVLAQEYSTTDFLVLCGHTHGSGEYRARPNLLVRTGKAKYGEPCVSGTFDL
jgi:predicted MPP superfamily phosphohydrolase